MKMQFLLPDPSRLHTGVFLIALYSLLPSFASAGDDEPFYESIILTECNSSGKYCLGLDLTQFGDYVVYINGRQFDGDYVACNYEKKDNILVGEGLAIRLGRGEYELSIVHKASRETETHLLNIACENDLTEDCDLNPNWISHEDADGLTIHLDAIAIADYEVLVDGEVYNGTMYPKDTKKLRVFKIKEMNGAPFFIHEWEVAGEIIRGKFNSGAELVAEVNQHSASPWRWDEHRALIFGADDAFACGDISISSIRDAGILKKLPLRKAEVTASIGISLPEGSHKVTVRHFVTGCEQSVDVEVLEPVAQKETE